MNAETDSLARELLAKAEQEADAIIEGHPTKFDVVSAFLRGYAHGSTTTVAMLQVDLVQLQSKIKK